MATHSSQFHFLSRSRCMVRLIRVRHRAITTSWCQCIQMCAAAVMQPHRFAITIRATSTTVYFSFLLLLPWCVSSNPITSGSSSDEPSSSLLGWAIGSGRTYVTACTESGALDDGALQLVADSISAGATTAHVARVQLSGPCHALGFIQLRGSLPANNQAHGPEPVFERITVLINAQHLLLNDLETPLDSSQLLFINSSRHASTSSQPTADDSVVQLQLHVTVGHDAPFFSSLALQYVARGCGASTDSASQPELFIDPVGAAARSALHKASHQRLGVAQAGGIAAAYEVGG